MSKIQKELTNDPLMPVRHTAEHVLQAAAQKLFPNIKKVMGPPIKGGFYFDFDLDYKITPEDLPKIEEEMKKIIEADLPIRGREVSYEEARALFKYNSYKLDIINELEAKKEKLTVYEIGSPQDAYYDIDLCAGPHVESTGKIKAFKLLSIAGAYYKGDEKNKMLQRIYGTAFDSKEALEDYLTKQEEAKKRDHRKLGKELDLFSIDEMVGPGLILWHPKLSIVREEIELYWRKEHRKRGYEYVYTPHVGLSKLWETSGHLNFYQDAMYPQMSMSDKSKNEQTTYFVKPMSCPFHIRIYKSRPRSYKELPLRWCELGSVYRYEESGVLHGMLRVRGFTQDDAHIFCAENQFIDEVKNILDFALDINKTLGFEKLNVYLAVRDLQKKEKYVGEERLWEMAEKTLEKLLSEKGLNYKKDIGGAKFYGPAIDLKVVDALGREWQGTTIQLDMNLPARFGMAYIDKSGKEVTPIMIHRALFGSMERFVGTLIEHFGGAFPVWLAPVQVIIIPISEKNVEYARKVQNLLLEEEIRAKINDKDETMQAKIREAQIEKIPYMAIVGLKEQQNQTISLRTRDNIKLESVPIAEFVAKVKEKYLTKSNILW